MFFKDPRQNSAWWLGGERVVKRPLALGRLTLIFLPVVALLLILGIIGVQLVRFTEVQAAKTGNFGVLPGTLSPLLKRSRLRGAANLQQRISLAIGLRPRNQTSLQAYSRDMFRRGSLNAHRVLSPAQAKTLFSPDEQKYGELLQFLRSSGFTITHTYSHRLLIAFSGTVEQVQRAFQVQINTYKSASGQIYYANATDPLLPREFANDVVTISGLNNASHWRHTPAGYHVITTKTAAPRGAVACPKHSKTYLTPDQVSTAYNLQKMYEAGYRGEGQTVALFELNKVRLSDLTTYQSCFEANRTNIEVIPTGSAPASSDEGMIEVEMDAELVLSAAPHLATLKLYEAANNSADIIAEWAQIIQDAVPVVSTSWGICEADADENLIRQESTFFSLGALQGQSIFAASGDSGATGCYFDTPDSTSSNLSALNAGDPGSQLFVTGVGGTTLKLHSDTTPAYETESAWNTPSSALLMGGASGGGISQYWVSPDWQDAPGVRNRYSTGQPCHAPAGMICREAPDVALHADPNNGYVIYCTAPEAGCESLHPWLTAGGTSAGTPIWAAFVALANQMSLQKGGFNLGFLNPLLYEIARDPVKYAESFHDIKTGTNDFNHLNDGSYPATDGYDMATGLGSYNAFALANNLVALSQQESGYRALQAHRSWYFADGRAGGDAEEKLAFLNSSPTRATSVDVTYLFEAKEPLTLHHSVPANARVTVDVNADLHLGARQPQERLATIVQVVGDGPGVVAERPLYFGFKGGKSGGVLAGVTQPATSFYFPLADTRQVGHTYDTTISLLNPGATQSATATLTYYTGGCGLKGQMLCPLDHITIAPQRRVVVSPLTRGLRQQFAVSVQSDQPIVAERSLVAQDTLVGLGSISGATSNAGAVAPAASWLFAEGFTGAGFQEYLTLANFAPTQAMATIKLAYDNGHSQTYQVAVPPLGRSTFNVNQANTHPDGQCDTTPCKLTSMFSTEITASAPIVAERLMYFRYGAQKIAGISTTIGESGPAAHSAYAFAEGNVGDAFHEFLTLYNPTEQREVVAITVLANGSILEQEVAVGAHSRRTVPINDWLAPALRASHPQGNDAYTVALTAQALGTNARIVAERAMYFSYQGAQGGSHAIGYAG